MPTCVSESTKTNNKRKKNNIKEVYKYILQKDKSVKSMG